MRKTIWRCAGAGLLACSLPIAAQNSTTAEPRLKDDLFAGTEKFAQNASSVTEVDMDPNTLDMVGGHNSNRARHTLLSVVHTYTYDKPGMYNMADVDAYRSKLNSGEWHCSVHVREMKSGESTDVCQHHRNDGLSESAIITVEPRSLTFIHTIRRPSGDGDKPGGAETWLSLPPMGLYDVWPLPEGGAARQANAAMLQAQRAILQAEMAAVRPELLADRAEMEAERMAAEAGDYAELARLGIAAREDGRAARFAAEQGRSLQEAQRQLERLHVHPPVPAVPPAPAPQP